MNTVAWVVLTCGICWAGISLYVFFLGRRQQQLARRINQLTSLLENNE